MTLVSPDPLYLEVVSKGADQPAQIRMALPDGSSHFDSLDHLDLKARLFQIQKEWRQGRPETAGQDLFQILFPGDLSAQFIAARKAAGQRGLRLFLSLDEQLPELHPIPWERMYFPMGDHWYPLVVDPDILFSRHLRTSQPWGLPLDFGPLRVLAVISSPFPPGNNLYVDPDIEKQTILSVYDQFQGQIEYEVLSGPVTVHQIADRLNQKPGFDILHYVGHGEWREDENKGFLLLSSRYPDGSLGPAGLSAAELTDIFRSSPHLPQCIFLGACESAQQSTSDAFAGVGPQFVNLGCPVVICMQEKVENGIARQFAQAFYTNFLETGCVDLAVNRARVKLLENPYYQWAVPVLYNHLADGILFNPIQRFRPVQRLPYKFLTSYQPEDSDLFKGRTAEIDEVYHHINEFPITIAYGEPGVGLTSLLEAGVRPRLEQDGWLVVRITNYANLASEFRQQSSSNGRPMILQVAGDAPLPNVLRAVNSTRFTTIALVLDQFEQVSSQPEVIQQAIQETLENSLQALGPRLKLVILLHKDSLGGLAGFQRLIDNRTGQWIKLQPLRLDEAVQAIVQPLEVLDWPVTLTRELASKYIAPDLGTLYGGENESSETIWIDPAHLQITCTWLYHKARSKQPPLVDDSLYLKEAGGADGILVRYMEEELETRFADQADLARRILVAMAAPEMDRYVTPDQILATPLFSNLENGASAPSVTEISDLFYRLSKAELLSRQFSNGSYRYAFANHMIADEAIRLGSEKIQQSYNANDELERTWRLWLATLVKTPPGSKTPDSALATRAQYHLLVENQAYLDARPVKYLLLLRSAVILDANPSPWIEKLRTKDNKSGLIQTLFDPAGSSTQTDLNSTSLELASRLLGINNPDIPARPQSNSSFSSLSWAAVNSQDSIDRRTAALTLAIIFSAEDQLLQHLDLALGAVQPPLTRFFRKIEIFGSLVNAGEIGEALKKRSPFERLGVYFWRVWRKAIHDRRWILWITLGSAIGAGLGLGFERLLVGTLARSPLGLPFFSLHSYWGFILAGFTGFLMALANSLQVDNTGKPPNPKSHNRLAFFLGILGFGLANMVVALLNNLSLEKAPLVIPLGFFAGVGLSAAFLEESSKFARVLIRAALAALSFAIIQVVFLADPQLGSGISIALSSGLIEVQFNHFTNSGWQSWIQSFSDWASLLAVVEAALSGYALAAGGLLGRHLTSRWYQRWSSYLDRFS